jgi:hypothetical protein
MIFQDWVSNFFKDTFVFRSVLLPDAALLSAEEVYEDELREVAGRREVCLALQVIRPVPRTSRPR